jgi:hypothetical protein
VRDRARRDRHASDERRRDVWAAVADAHSTVPAEPFWSADYDGYDGYDTVVSLEAAANLVPAPDHAASRTAPRGENPKRLLAHLAAAAPCRLCLLDWSDHGPPFR